VQVTRDEDLELIFSRFGEIVSCDIIREHGTNESLCYGFVAFTERSSCEMAYTKMNNVLIDDRCVPPSRRFAARLRFSPLL
jgi:peptidyl-prolyl cis-trans isomerase-like 4